MLALLWVRRVLLRPLLRSPDLRPILLLSTDYTFSPLRLRAERRFSILTFYYYGGVEQQLSTLFWVELPAPANYCVYLKQNN